MGLEALLLASAAPLDAAGLRFTYMCSGLTRIEIVAMAVRDSSLALLGVTGIFIYVGLHTGSGWLAAAALLQVEPTLRNA